MKPHELDDMASISCFAASEIDEGILGRNDEGYECCERVAQKLTRAAENWKEDPTFTLNVYHAAGWKDRDITEVLPRIASVAAELEGVTDLPEKRRRELMHFCIDLSQQLISYDRYGPCFLTA